MKNKVKLRFLKCIRNILTETCFWISIKQPKGIYRWAFKDVITYWYDLGFYKVGGLIE